MPAVAITDSGNLFGSLEFAEYAAGRGIQLIIGCNIIVKHSEQNLPILLLAKNEQGYTNLVTLVSESFKKRKNNSDIPYVDFDELLNLSMGLIALTGGCLAQLLLGQDKETVEKLLSAFDGHLYVELQRHGLNKELELEEALIDFAYQRNVPLVATNDVFFPNRSDYEAYDILTCISEGSYALENNRKKLTTEHYFKSVAEMEELFSDIPEAIHNTLVIAKRCSYMPRSRQPILPKFPCRENKTENEELREQAVAGLEFRIANETDIDLKQYYDRLNYELSVITSMNYAGYFLIVSDFIRWSKANGIPVGPGRGSGAGSIVAWGLQITDLDPIKFGLIFERFLNPDRVSMPDFDIDFCQEKRDLVIDYVQKKYGYVAQIITFGKLQARAVLRDVGRVLQMPYSQVDKISKMVPFNPVNPVTLSQAIEFDQNLQKERDSDEVIAKLLDISLKLEGIYRHVSTHAAGIVICDQKLENFVPVYYDPNSALPITQYSMKYVEKAGLIKFDFLGLGTLTLIDHVCRLINRDEKKIDISSVPLNDQKTYEMLSSGDSIGVFQLESSGMREALIKLKPDCIEDIIALISLYRPGPMDNIPTYVARKHGLEKPDYIHPLLEGVLKETFGVIIYQEQVMEIARILSGYSLAEADLLRRAMGKKIKEEMDKQRELFIQGATKNGVDYDRASYIFDLVAKFAGYGFNKSHAAAYAVISYQTAYLKANYPLEFFTALMNLNIDDRDKLNLFYHAAKFSGVTVLPPDINKSQAEFSIEGECIRYGIAALRNVGFSIAEGIVNTRSSAYKDIWEFIQNSGHIINKRALESLIKSGAFDSVHKNRKQLYESMDMLIYFANKNKQDRESSQAALFGSLDVLKPKFENVEDFDEEEKLEHELFSLGFYLTNHPLEKFRILLEKLNIGFIGENRTAKTAGVILNARMRTSERGRFVILTLSDPHNVSEIAFYNNEIIEEKRDLFSPGTFVIIDLEASENTTRLAGKDISEFTKRITSTIKELVLTTECTDSQKAAMELNTILKDEGRTKIMLKLLLEKHKEDIVNLYEFTFIAQQGLLQQEVEEMVQELAVSLKNIKADVIFQKIKSLMERQNSTLTKQELETRAENIKEGLVAYSDFLEDLTKILWVELEEDLSNLKEVKSKIDKELKDDLKDLGITQDFIKFLGGSEQITKSAFIHNAVNALKRNISEHLIKIFQDILKDFRINGPTQSSKALEMLLENIEASGLIKYEHWGLLDFAYPINKMKSGHYCIMCISSTASILDEFVRRMKLNENVIRHLTGFRRSKVCPLAASKDEDIDYKNTDLLSKFTSDYGRILPRRLTGENIRTLGKLGEIVKVKPGYARNFLFPQRKAVKATKENLAKLEEQRLLLEEENTKKLNVAKELASSLHDKFVILIKQASEDGKIFGSVTTREIAKVLLQEGHAIDHRNLSFGGISIKNLGEYQVNVELHSEVVVPITIYVVKSETDANELRQVKLQNQKSQQQEAEQDANKEATDGGEAD
ncbi:DNA polymerase III subunit alpha [Trichonephila inaurata madagascariensis]|uniref:Small ribosomal subunit protein bS6m n=1 Tax=Trichonephila inaurata madagascariensis TaxID=2747483 RepID=A0A8X7CDI0_9ARAC|nr:DNA polymerase III subunit alpha [Trichonephila inaurata madagascariensis]